MEITEVWEVQFRDTRNVDQYGALFVGARRNKEGHWSQNIPDYLSQLLNLSRQGKCFYSTYVKVNQLLGRAKGPIRLSAKGSAMRGIVNVKRKISKSRTIPRSVPAIRSLKALCTFFGADSPNGLNYQLYKDTACGASISVLTPDCAWHHNGEDWKKVRRIIAFTLQTIIEGSDIRVESPLFVLPVTQEEISTWLQEMERQVGEMWDHENESEEE